MNPLRLSVRFPVDETPSDLEPAIGVFHRFIQKGQVEGLLIDVADYRHVPGGPGVLLIAHEFDYGISDAAFTVTRKRSSSATAGAQTRDALRAGIDALDAIAYDGALAISVDRSRFTVTVADRQLGTRDQVTSALLAEVSPVVADVYGTDATVTPIEDGPRQARSVRVDVSISTVDGALERLGGSRAPGQSPWDISVEELARLRAEAQDHVLIDVREESEHAIVDIGGRLLPLTSLGDHIDDLDRDVTTVVHCRAGLRGAVAAEQLRTAGFGNVWNLNGGLMAWIDRVDPTLQRY